jgi:hypothetical protein
MEMTLTYARIALEYTGGEDEEPGRAIRSYRHGSQSHRLLFGMSRAALAQKRARPPTPSPATRPM